MTPDQAVVEAAEAIIADALAEVVVSCPFPGLDGAQIEYGPRRGGCRYLAEQMDPVDGPPYWRCPVHGTIPTPRT